MTSSGSHNGSASTRATSRLARRSGSSCSTAANPTAPAWGVYAQAEASELLLDDADDAVRVFSDRSVAHGGGTWDGERLVSMGLRLCCAVPSELSLLPGEGTADRVEVPRA